MLSLKTLSCLKAIFWCLSFNLGLASNCLGLDLEVRCLGSLGHSLADFFYFLQSPRGPATKVDPTHCATYLRTIMLHQDC